MRALQEQEDWAAIQQGLKEREEGLGQPLSEVDAEIRDELGFPPRAWAGLASSSRSGIPA